MSAAAEWAGKPIFERPLTEQSLDGTYVVITASGTCYVIELSSPDLPPQITRHPRQRRLIGDGIPMPGVNSFFFDIDTGDGWISWWKDDPATYDRPDQPYLGTVRTTSTVLLVARIDDHTRLTDPDPARTAERDLLISQLRDAYAALHAETEGSAS